MHTMTFPTNVSNDKMEVEVIEPGLVVLRHFLDDHECQRIAEMAQDWGNRGENGFYTVNESGQKVLNTGENRGRIYDAATRFPLDVIHHSHQAALAACDADPAMPNMECTHLLLNMYTTSEGLVWHRDIYENDGKSDHPVVNLSIGATCVFGFKHEDTDEERTIYLRSGDILLFGGPCRLIKHAVLEILLEDCPDWMKDNPCRFSLTFRDSPEVLGREQEFKYFRIKEHLVGQEDFQLPEDPKCFRGLPSQPSQNNRNKEKLPVPIARPFLRKTPSQFLPKQFLVVSHSSGQ